MPGPEKSAGRRAIQVLFAATLGGLAYLNWYIVEDMSLNVAGVPNAAQSQAAKPQILANSFADFDMKPLAAFSETAARPLFNPSRRPETAPEAVAPLPATEASDHDKPVPDQARIVGIISSGAGGPRVLIRADEGQPATWLGVGEQLGEWKLSDVSKDAATFAAGSQRFTMRLYPDNSKGAKP